jgi:hypothetical protein
VVGPGPQPVSHKFSLGLLYLSFLSRDIDKDGECGNLSLKRRLKFGGDMIADLLETLRDDQHPLYIPTSPNDKFPIVRWAN